VRINPLNVQRELIIPYFPRAADAKKSRYF